jgi:hypothetical protein
VAFFNTSSVYETSGVHETAYAFSDILIKSYGMFYHVKMFAFSA